MTAELASAVLGALALLFLLLALDGRLRRHVVSQRLGAFLQVEDSEATPRVRSGSVWAPVLRRLGGLVARRLPSRLTSVLRRQAQRAGQSPAAMEVLLGARLAAVCVGGLLAFAFTRADGGVLAQIGAVVVGAIALSGVDLVLIARADARGRTVARDLPTLLDLLSLTMAAGMGFDLALSTILEHLDGPLADELRRYLTDVNDLGVARAEALEGVAQRLGDPPDLVALLEALNRAHLLGTGLLAAVSSQSALLQQERRRRAAAAAQRAPVRMLIPMTLFMLPVLMLVILAPVALRLLNAVK